MTKPHLDKVIQTINEINYKGWIVVEQDSTMYSPYSSAKGSASWLAKKGFPIEDKSDQKDIDESITLNIGNLPEKFGSLFPILMQSIRCHDLRFFCNTILENLVKTMSCISGTMWEYCPSKNLLGLLACWSSDDSIREKLESGPYILDCLNDLSGLAVERKVATILNPHDPPDGKIFLRQGFINEFKISKIISIPILNTYNTNHTELVINLHSQIDKKSINDQELKELTRCAEFIAIAYESLIEDLCLYSAEMVNMAVDNSEKVNEFLDKTIKTIQEMLNCEGITIFLVNQAGDKLEPRATTGFEWNLFVSDNEKYYTMGEGITGRVWQTRLPLLTINAKEEIGYKGKSFENVIKSLQGDVCLIIPLIDLIDSHGTVIGVIRCRNRNKGKVLPDVNMFTESDLSILDAIGRAIVPHLSTLVADERRARTFGRLTHELKVPLATIRGAADLIINEIKHLAINEHETEASIIGVLKSCLNYANDICSWYELARRLFNGADFFRHRVEGLQLKPERCHLINDIFDPAKNQLGQVLKERRFSKGRISCIGLRGMPRLWIDKNQFQQIFFNLIGNAIKYAYDDPTAFEVEIIGGHTGNGYEILFRNWGPEIPEGWEERIFDEGVRGPDAEEQNVAGNGLGLWIVREIITKHGGFITLSKRHWPTEFKIEFPYRLAGPWVPKTL